MNARQRRTLRAVFEDPLRPDIRWSDIEGLLRGIGADLSEGRGSRVRVSLRGIDAVFHRPHPRPETDRGAVRSVRRLLIEAGIDPSDGSAFDVDH